MTITFREQAFAVLAIIQGHWYVKYLWSEVPGAGCGLMAMVCAWADENKKPLMLEADNNNYDKLVAWYQHYGFREIGMGFMARMPKGD